MVGLKTFVEDRFHYEAGPNGNLVLYQDGNIATVEHLKRTVAKARRCGVIAKDAGATWEAEKLTDLVPVVLATRYMPGGDRLFEENYATYKNSWVGSHIRPSADSSVWPSERPEPWDEYLTRMFPDEEQKAFYEGWLAALVREPTRVCNVAILLRSEPGVGKNVMHDRVVSPLIGKANAPTVILSQLTNQFNEQVTNSTCIFVDEVYNNKAYASNRLKVWTGNGTQWVEAKGRDAHAKDVYHRLVIASNSERPLFIEEGDRRYWVPDWIEHKIDVFETRDFVGRFLGWLQNEDGLQQIRDWLELVQIPDLTVAPPTKAKLEITAQDKSGERKAQVGLLIDHNGPDVAYTLTELQQRFWRYRISDAELIAVLKDRGFVSRQTSICGQKGRFWVHPDGGPDVYLYRATDAFL